jgi:hypothetical protein
VAWLANAGASAHLAYGVGSSTGLTPVELRGTGDAEPWQLEGEHVSLVFSPTGPAVRGGRHDAGVETLDQLCNVSGALTLEGSEHEVGCAGWRAIVEGEFELSGLDSFRQTAGWFEAGGGIALSALRPRKSRGQDADLVAAAVLDPEPVGPIDDPRLSTTYDERGLPRRVGLELWFEQEASGEEPPEPTGAEQDDQSERHFARRAAAEAVGASIEWSAADVKLHATRLHWHSRGSDGAGVYLLGQHE